MRFVTDESGRTLKEAIMFWRHILLHNFSASIPTKVGLRIPGLLPDSSKKDLQQRKHILLIIRHIWYRVGVSPMRVTCSDCLILLDLITRMIFDEDYRAKSCSLCSLFHFPISWSLLSTNKYRLSCKLVGLCIDWASPFSHQFKLMKNMFSEELK
jgi:hypothetical protein